MALQTVKHQCEHEAEGFLCLSAALTPRHTSAQAVPPPGALFGDVEMGLTQPGDALPKSHGDTQVTALKSPIFVLGRFGVIHDLVGSH